MGNERRGAVSWMKLALSLHASSSSTTSTGKKATNSEGSIGGHGSLKTTTPTSSKKNYGKQIPNSSSGGKSRSSKKLQGDDIDRDRGEAVKAEDELSPLTDPAADSDVGRSRLEEAFRRITESKEVKAQMDRIFKKVRIMVVGRSGSGKTTVIRLVVGQKGPRSMSVGEAGLQDISVEWHHPDPELPLVFHDSNGIDVVGSSRIDDIRRFLDERQSADGSFSDRVHVVWYVFSAADTRFLDDGGLMEMLDSYPNLPVLLLMTFNDHEKMVKKNVDGGNLEKLLGRVRDVERRDRIRTGMVRIGNDVEQEEDGSISGVRDVDGLRRLTLGTKELIGKELHATWAACQANNLDEKLSASVKLILGAKRSEIFSTCLLGALPLAQQAQLGYMLMTVTRSLCKVWGVPENMQKAMVGEFLMSEGGRGVLTNVLYNVGAAIGVAGTVAAAVFTAGAAAAAVVGALVVSALSQMKATSSLLMSYSLVLLGCTLFVKSRLPAGEIAFDGARSVDYYAEECRSFAKSDDISLIKSFVGRFGPAWDSGAQTKQEMSMLKNNLIQFFDGLILHRPNALFMAFRREDVDDSLAGHGYGRCSSSAAEAVNCGGVEGYDIDPETLVPKRKTENLKSNPPKTDRPYKSIFDDSDSDDNNSINVNVDEGYEPRRLPKNNKSETMKSILSKLEEPHKSFFDEDSESDDDIYKFQLDFASNFDDAR